MAVAAPALPWIAAGLAGMSAIQQGNAAAAENEFNANVSSQDAQIADMDAEFAAGRFREDTARLLGAQAAATGKNGLAASGSPMLIMAETAADAEIDALNIRRRGAVEAGRLRTQGGFYNLAGASAQKAGYLGAGSALLTGASSFFED